MVADHCASGSRWVSLCLTGGSNYKLDPDGTVTLRLSHDTTGKAEDTNFLPVPNEHFHLVLRMYGGDEQIQAGKFPVPIVQKVGK